MTISNLVVTTTQADNGYMPLLVTASNNPTTTTVEIVNPTTSIVIATVAVPLAAQETSRTWTAANVTGTVSGLTASGTNAIADTITLDPGERCRYTLVSTWSLTPIDPFNEPVDLSTSTIIATVTETTVAGVSVSDPDPYEYPARSVYFRVSSGWSTPTKPSPFFAVRTRNVEQILSALTERMTDAETQRVIDWLEAGNSLATLTVPRDIVLRERFAGHATAGSTIEQALFTAPSNGRIIAVEFTTDTAITGANTNYCTLNIRNRTTAGVGTAVPATLGFVSGVNTVALTPKAIPLSSTVTDLNFVKGDVITAEKAVAGTGLAMPPGQVVIHYVLR